MANGQAEQIDGFLNMMIGALDSRPVFALPIAENLMQTAGAKNMLQPFDSQISSQICCVS